MTSYLADLTAASEYRVQLEFTPSLDPSMVAQGMPFVSLITEIDANSSTATAEELRRQYGRIPYGAPLYWWETHSTSGVATCAYIGQTVRLRVQKRFESHAAVVRLLAEHVNSPDTRVTFRLCSRFEIMQGNHRFAIEHLPPDQAAKVVSDVEAHLIYVNKPALNQQHKSRPRMPWKPFVVESIRFR